MPDRRTFLSQSAIAAVGLFPPVPRARLAQAVTPAPANAATLRAHATARGLFYGSAVDIGLLRTDAAYRQLLAAQCNILVSENAMKWAAIHPSADRYDFSQADELLAFAEQHGIAVRGHNLCWHEALPPWFAATVTPQNGARTLTDHIHTVAGRYHGRVRSWDVVNEAIDPKDGRPDGLRDSPWLRLVGPNYLELAFQAARQADPHALLTYNDYGIEYDHPDSVNKRMAVLALLRRFQAEGVPIDAVGVQSHLDATTNELGAGISAFVAEVGKMGLRVFITELDVNDDNIVPDDPATRDTAVSRAYHEYVTAVLTNTAVTDVLTWGVSDNHSWLNHSKSHQEKHPGRRQRPLPFDAAYQPKPAFYALRDALDSRKT